MNAPKKEYLRLILAVIWSKNDPEQIKEDHYTI
jgi:hypothetical protein